MSKKAGFLVFLVEHLTNVETGWSVGTFGAIAEFTRDGDEMAELIAPPMRFRW